MRKALQIIVNKFDGYIKDSINQVKQDMQIDLDLKLKDFKDSLQLVKDSKLVESIATS